MCTDAGHQIVKLDRGETKVMLLLEELVKLAKVRAPLAYLVNPDMATNLTSSAFLLQKATLCHSKDTTKQTLSNIARFILLRHYALSHFQLKVTDMG